jgi:hypothetical protein
MDGSQPAGWTSVLGVLENPIFQSDNFQSNFWASAFGALVGAGSAFLLERIHAAHAERKRRVSFGNQATHTLSLMYSVLASTEKALFGDYREANKGKSPHPLEVQGTNDTHAGTLQFNLAELAFLSETHDPDILNRLLIAERRFRVTLDIANHRSRLHLEIQDLLGNAGFGPGAVITPAKVAGACGHHRVKQLEDLHNDLLTSLPREMASIKALANELRDVLKYTFPWSRVITYTTDVTEMADYRKTAKPAWWRIVARYLRQLTLAPKRTLKTSWQQICARLSQTKDSPIA